MLHLNKCLMLFFLTIFSSLFSSLNHFPRGRNLELNIISCLNSGSDAARAVRDGNYDRAKQIFIFFEPHLRIELLDHIEHRRNALIGYDEQLRKYGKVECTMDPKCPPNYMLDTDQEVEMRFNGVADGAKTVKFDKMVDMKEYLIPYSLTLSEQPFNTFAIEIPYDPDNSTIEIPVELKEIDFAQKQSYLSYYYPDAKSKTKVYRGTFCKNDDIRRKEHNFETISIRELVKNNNMQKNEYLFLSLKRLSSLSDSLFDRFPDSIYLKIKLDVSQKNNLVSDKEVMRKASIYGYIVGNKFYFCALTSMCSLLVWWCYSNFRKA